MPADQSVGTADRRVWRRVGTLPYGSDPISGTRQRGLMDDNTRQVVRHYDLLIEENNDPFRDPPALRRYMSGWDGDAFWDALALDPSQSVLEIGVGTGRLAAQVAPRCKRLTGIDVSPKTIERARENLKEYHNIMLVCGDFTAYAFQETFDAVYASLTMMHFADKRGVIEKAAALLNPGGLLCLSLDKNRSEWIDMGARRVKIYPDDPEQTAAWMTAAGLRVTVTSETPFAHIVAGEKRK